MTKMCTCAHVWYINLHISMYQWYSVHNRGVLSSYSLLLRRCLTEHGIMDMFPVSSHSFQSKCENGQSITQSVHFLWRRNRPWCFCCLDRCFRCCSVGQWPYASTVTQWSRNQKRTLTCLSQNLHHRLLGISCPPATQSRPSAIATSSSVDYWRSSSKENTLDVMWSWELRCPGWRKHCILMCSVWKLYMECFTGAVLFDLPVIWRNRGSVSFSVLIEHLCQSIEYKCNVPSDVGYWTAYIVLYMMRIV